MLQNQQQGGFLGSGFCNALIQGFVPGLGGEQVAEQRFNHRPIRFRSVGGDGGGVNDFFALLFAQVRQYPRQMFLEVRLIHFQLAATICQVLACCPREWDVCQAIRGVLVQAQPTRTSVAQHIQHTQTVFARQGAPL